MTEKRAEDGTGSKRDGRKGEATIDRRKTRGDPDDLQAERGGLKVNDSDFKTK